LLPVEAKDHSMILDRYLYKTKLYLQDGGTSTLKLGEKFFRHYFMNVGKLPVCYTKSPESRVLHVLKNSLSLFENSPQNHNVLVAPCISQITKNSVQALIEFEETTGHIPGLKFIIPDKVVFAKNNGCDDENVKIFFQKIFKKRLFQIIMMPGYTTTQKFLLVLDSTVVTIYKNMQDSINDNKIINNNID
jgi:hypothetical protein